MAKKPAASAVPLTKFVPFVSDPFLCEAPGGPIPGKRGPTLFPAQYLSSGRQHLLLLRDDLFLDVGRDLAVGGKLHREGPLALG